MPVENVVGILRVHHVITMPGVQSPRRDNKKRWPRPDPTTTEPRTAIGKGKLVV